MKGHFVKTAYGHCVNVKVRSDKLRKGANCDKWKPYELQLVEDREAIELVLKDIRKSLSQIKEALEAEK